jgi:hypothetical protein
VGHLGLRLALGLSGGDDLHDDDPVTEQFLEGLKAHILRDKSLLLIA